MRPSKLGPPANYGYLLLSCSFDPCEVNWLPAHLQRSWCPPKSLIVELWLEVHSWIRGPTLDHVNEQWVSMQRFQIRMWFVFTLTLLASRWTAKATCHQVQQLFLPFPVILTYLPYILKFSGKYSRSVVVSLDCVLFLSSQFSPRGTSVSHQKHLDRLKHLFALDAPSYWPRLVCEDYCIWVDRECDLGPSIVSLPH